MPPILFVRHSKPTIVVGEPAASWALSATGGDRARGLGDRLRSSAHGFELFSSAEVKASQTAGLLGIGTPTIDPAFGEVAKPWYDSPADHEAAAAAFLRGADHDTWEPRADALARFGDAVNRAIGLAGDRVPIIATHGTVLSLWLSEQLSDLDPVGFWLGLEMPDAWWFEVIDDIEPVLRHA